MTLTHAVFRNLATLLVGKGGNLLLSFFTVVVVTRVLGVEGFGVYATVLAFVQLFGVVADFGLSIVANTELGKRPKEEWQPFFSGLYSLRLVVALLVLFSAPLVVLALPYPAPIPVGVWYGMLATFALMLRDPLLAIFQNHLRMWPVALAELVGKFVILGGTLAVAWRGGDVLAILAVLAIGNVILLAITLLFARRLLRFTFNIDPLLWRRILALAWPTGIAFALNVIYFKGDTFILSLFRTQGEVGLYGAPYKVLEVLIVFPAIFTGLVLPVISRAFVAHDTVRLSRLFARSFEALAILAFPLTVGTFFVAPEVMALVAGEPFRASGEVMKVLSLAVTLIYFGTFTTSTVVAVGRQRAMLPAYLFVAVLAVLGYLATIPRFGMWGAAWMTVTTEAAILVFSLWHILTASGARIAPGGLVRILFASLVMGGALIGTEGSGLWVQFIAAGVVYAGALILLRVVTLADVREILALRAAPATLLRD